MRRRALLAMLCTVAALAPLAAAPASASGDEGPVRLLVYSATYGFRHGSIATARAEFTKIGATDEFDVTLTEDPSDITASVLEEHDVLVLVNATGEHPWSEQQRADLLDWVDAGGGIVATHASIDANYYWSDYGDLVGGYFLAHPHTGVATNNVEDPTSPFVRHLPAPYAINEEYYRLQLDPRPNVRVLTSLDRATAGSTGPSYVEDQPTTWCQEFGGGRSFTTLWGHFDATYSNADVQTMLLQGFRWAAGRLEADCSPTVERGPGLLQAEHADQISAGRKETSTLDGANQVVTEILTGQYLLFEDVDLTDAGVFRVQASPETAPEPRPYHVPVATPALGGVVELRLDRLRDDAGQLTPVVASVTLDGRTPGWRVLEAALPDGLAGLRDVYVTFREPVSSALGASRIVVPEVTDAAYLMSLDWVEFA